MSAESAFIASLRSLATHPAARGLDDDAAVLEIGGETLVLSHDMIVGGIHYFRTDPPRDVAWKLVGVTLSDLAAKGAQPLGVLLGFTLGEADWDRDFAGGLGEALARYGAPLLGGDTVATPSGAPHILGLTAIGRATGPVPARSGARVGDALWVTGTIGDAMMGYFQIKGDREGPAALLQAYRRPVPRLAEGQALAPLVHAMMDVSDGLLLDAGRMARASNCTVDIEADAVPFSDAFMADQGGNQLDHLSRFIYARLQAMGWGDDYELLFAAPESFAPPVPATRIGRFVGAGPHPVLLDAEPPPSWQGLGYQHGDKSAWRRAGMPDFDG